MLRLTGAPALPQQGPEAEGGQKALELKEGTCVVD